MEKEEIIEKLEKHGFEFNLDWGMTFGFKMAKHQSFTANKTVPIYCLYPLIGKLMKRKLERLLNKYSLPLNTYIKVLY